MTRDWFAATATHRGAHHEYGGLPNEDHARAVLDGTPGVITVADGHGAPRYTRAARGAELATRAAVEVLRSHHHDTDGLPRALVDRWRELVEADVRADPPPAHEARRRDAFELYGTTLLAAAALGEELLLVQLGDGDTILGARGGRDVLRPVPAVEYPFPNATDSLVQPGAADAVRVVRVPIEAQDTDLVLLATDGLAAAQATDGWHGACMADLYDRLAGAPAAEVDDALATVCRRAAAAGGDDTTVAVMVRRRLLVDGAP